MANPPNARAITRPMDPKDIVLRVIEISRGDTDADMLRPAQGVASFTLALTPEAVAAGLEIKDDDGYAITLVGDDVSFYLGVADDLQLDPLFDGGGVTLGIELTVVTDDVPLQRIQRTVTQQVAQQ